MEICCKRIRQLNHLCERNEGCLNISVELLHFEILEWLNSHIEFNNIQIVLMNHCYIITWMKTIQKREIIIITILLILKQKNQASMHSCLDVIKYIYKTCYTNVETKDQDGSTTIMYVSCAYLHLTNLT